MSFDELELDTEAILELAATVRQLPANVGATGLQLLVEAVNAKTAPAEPKKVMVKAELVTK